MATIVLAEDEDDLRAIYAAYLRSSGFDVFEASHGLEALDLIRTNHPDLLLLDLWMPFLNGFGVLEALRYDGVSGHTKVVVLSCQGDAEARLECFGEGAVDLVVGAAPSPRNENAVPAQATGVLPAGSLLPPPIRPEPEPAAQGGGAEEDRPVDDRPASPPSSAALAASPVGKLPAGVTAALADKTRPEADTKLDAARKPGELIAFAGVKPGQRIVGQHRVVAVQQGVPHGPLVIDERHHAPLGEGLGLGA